MLNKSKVVKKEIRGKGQGPRLNPGVQYKNSKTVKRGIQKRLGPVEKRNKLTKKVRKTNKRTHLPPSRRPSSTMYRTVKLLIITSQ